MSVEDINAVKLTESDVEKYLKSHPEFFVKHPDVVDGLRIPHHDGEAVSLLQHQINLLRSRNSDFHTRLDQLLDHARDNDRKFAQTRRFVLRAMEAQTLAELYESVMHSLKDDFGVEACELVIFSENEIEGCRTARIIEANRHIGGILTSPKASCGRFTPEELSWLFKRDDMQSAAIASIAQVQQFGVLAIGHSDPTYYRSGMGTLFLNYVTEVLVRAIPRLLNER